RSPSPTTWTTRPCSATWGRCRAPRWSKGWPRPSKPSAGCGRRGDLTRRIWKPEARPLALRDRASALRAAEVDIQPALATHLTDNWRFLRTELPVPFLLHRRGLREHELHRDAILPLRDARTGLAGHLEGPRIFLVQGRVGVVVLPLRDDGVEDDDGG